MITSSQIARAKLEVPIPKGLEVLLQSQGWGNYTLLISAVATEQGDARDAIREFASDLNRAAWRSA